MRGGAPWTARPPGATFLSASLAPACSILPRQGRHAALTIMDIPAMLVNLVIWRHALGSGASNHKLLL